MISPDHLGRLDISYRYPTFLKDTQPALIKPDNFKIPNTFILFAVPNSFLILLNVETNIWGKTGAITRSVGNC